MNWETITDLQPLGDDEICVWKISVQSLYAFRNYFIEFLNDEELKKTDRLVFAKDRDVFVVARVVLRLLLAAYLQRNAKEIEFSCNSHGKLRLDNDVLKFNLSHSGDLVLIAFSKQHEVGIDVEFMRSNIDCLGIAGHYFANNEITQLRECDSDDIVPSFYRCWTRKEAFVKALGVGLANNLKNFTVDVRLGVQDLLKNVDIPFVDAEVWRVLDLSDNVDYAAALAVAGPILGVNCYLFSEVFLRRLLYVIGENEPR